MKEQDINDLMTPTLNVQKRHLHRHKAGLEEQLPAPMALLSRWKCSRTRSWLASHNSVNSLKGTEFCLGLFIIYLKKDRTAAFKNIWHEMFLSIILN